MDELFCCKTVVIGMVCKMKKIVLMCQQYGCPLELSPARYQLIHELRKQKYEIYVFFPGNVMDKSIKEEIHHCINTLSLSTREIRKKIENIMPQYIIAFTYEDAIILYNLKHKMKSTEFIYYNLEIYTPSMEKYIQAEGKFLRVRCYMSYFCNKIKEVFFTQQCSVFIIQDKLRKKTSAKYFIKHPNTMLIPNSYKSCKMERNRNEREGLIYSGGLNKLQLESMFSQVGKIPNIPITFSGWSDSWFQLQYKKIHKLHPNINFVNQKLPSEKLSEYLNKYSVGLIWYSPIKDENIKNIGLASGKLFKHLSIGQPVIVVDCPGISQVIRKYKLGIVIDDIEGLQEAYENIMNHYLYYCKNVERVYNAKFDYMKVIQPLLQKIGEL